jgi:hypothetical protein
VTAMRRWEYTHCYERELDEMGEDGWQCYFITEIGPHDGTRTRLYHMRREKKEEENDHASD